MPYISTLRSYRSRGVKQVLNLIARINPTKIFLHLPGDWNGLNCIINNFSNMMIMYFLIKVRNTGRWVQPVPQVNYWSIHIKITPSLLTLFPDAPLVPIFNHWLRILFCCLSLPILIPNSLLVQISYHKLKILFCCAYILPSTAYWGESNAGQILFLSKH